MKILEPKGFIKAYRDLILDHIPCTKSWAQTVALGTLSTPLGPGTVISTRFGKLRLNINALTIGPSGIPYKSLALKEYTIPTIIRASEPDLANFDLLLPAGFSIEGMIQYLANHVNTGIIVKDEFTKLLKDSKHKMYCSDMAEFLSQLYDGMIQKRFTRKAQLEYVRSCYASLLSATTPYVYSLLDNNFFMQGLGNRFLYDVFPRDFEVKLYDGKDLFFDVKQSTQRDKDIEKFAKTIADLLARNQPDFVMPYDDASEMLADFRNECTLKSKKEYDKNPLSIESSYLHRLPAKALKLSALHAVSRFCWREPWGEICALDDYDAKWGIQEARHYLNSYRQMIDEWRILGARPVPVETQTNYFEMVRSTLKLWGGTMMHEDFCKETDIERTKVRQIMGEMRDRGEIIIAKGLGSSGGGRKPDIYKLVGYLAEPKGNSLLPKEGTS